jgi:hypothetical protein
MRLAPALSTEAKVTAYQFSLSKMSRAVVSTAPIRSSESAAFIQKRESGGRRSFRRSAGRLRRGSSLTETRSRIAPAGGRAASLRIAML